MKGRFLDVVLKDPFANLALEEALLAEARVPTLRVWRNQESVVIGRAQLAEYETDVRYCKEHSIPIVRRITAGGTVYNGSGNLNWSFFIPRGAESPVMKTSGPKSVFESFAGIVIEALEKCGVHARFSAPNSISNERGKVSGMAAYMSKDAVLCHGTLLVDADLRIVQRLTMPSGEGLHRRYPRSRHTAVSNCGVDEAMFATELAGASGYTVKKGNLTSKERAIATRLAKSKYRSDEWNLGDPFA